LCNLGIKTRQLRFVLGKLLIVEALLQNRVLHQVAIGLLWNDQWATVEQRLVTCDLRLEARNLLTQLLDIRGSESWVEVRQELILPDLIALPDIEALDDRRIEGLKDRDGSRSHNLSACAGYNPVEPCHDHQDYQARQHGSERQ